MGMTKNYLLKVLELCSEEKFGQDAIEWAIVSGLVPLSYDLDQDIREIMSRYDQIIEGYRQSMARPTHQSLNRHAPMKRAVPQRRAKAGQVNPATKKRRAA
jgi:hypothetical protein